MSVWVPIAGWTIVVLLLAGTGVVVALGVEALIRGYQYLEQLRQDRLDEESN